METLCHLYVSSDVMIWCSHLSSLLFNFSWTKEYHKIVSFLSFCEFSRTSVCILFSFKNIISNLDHIYILLFYTWIYFNILTIVHYIYFNYGDVVCANVHVRYFFVLYIFWNVQYQYCSGFIYKSVKKLWYSFSISLTLTFIYTPAADWPRYPRSTSQEWRLWDYLCCNYLFHLFLSH